MSQIPTRGDAWTLLTEFTDNPSLIKHALGVEAAMRAYARSYGEDEEMWATIGLIHDFDYQQNPTEETHLHVGTGILRERGWPEEWVRIVASHADYMGVPRDSRAAKTLFAVDELTGADQSADPPGFSGRELSESRCDTALGCSAQAEFNGEEGNGDDNETSKI